MNRVGARARARASGSAGSCPRHAPQFAPLADARGDLERAERWRSQVQRPAAPLEREAGTATGTGAPTSMTARRSAPPVNAECRIDSIAQSWSVLSGSRGPARGTARDGRRRAASGRVATTGWCCFSRRRSTPPTSTRATSRATCRASARTAASTPTPRSGRSSRLPALGEGDKAADAVSMLNPINHAAHVPGSIATRLNPTWSRPTCTRSRHMSAAADGPGTRDQRAGCIGRARVDPRISGARRAFCFDPCIPRAWPRFEIVFRYHSSRYEVVVEPPWGVGRGRVGVARRTGAAGRRGRHRPDRR